MLLSQFPLTFHHIHNTMPCFITLLMTILVLIGMVYSRVPWEYIFKLNAFSAASEFCEWFQAGIDVYIPHHNYQVRPLFVLLSSQKLGLLDFRPIANIILSNGKSTAQRYCLLHLIKQDCLLKTSLRILIMMIQISLYLFSLLELI